MTYAVRQSFEIEILKDNEYVFENLSDKNEKPIAIN